MIEVALILTVDTDVYDDALRAADALAEGLNFDGEKVSAVLTYDALPDGTRVVYLPKVSA